MKILKILTLIFNIIAIVFIPISFFSDVSGKLVIGIIGYVSLFVGAVLSFILNVLRKNTDPKIKSINKDNEK